LALHEKFTSNFTPASLLNRWHWAVIERSRHAGMEETDMKLSRNASILALGLATLLGSATPKALATCGVSIKPIKPSAWSPQYGAARLTRTADDDAADKGNIPSIVGMWHVVFTADTALGGVTIPPTVVDNALAVWHADHTEVMNSVRPPQDGNFCLGVWEQSGSNKYYLNHFAWYANEFPNTNASGIGDPQGPTQFQEWVTVSPDGCHFTGSFHLTAYDLSNNVLAAFTGTLAGTRITVTTTEKDLVTN
jgi:hypothetical protein